MSVDHAAIAAQLEAAWTTGAPVEPLTDTVPGFDVSDAYRVQDAWTALRIGAGETIVGRKIGLTSAAVQAQMNVDEPDYGTLWASRHLTTVGGRAEVDAAVFVAPRAEGELAFLIGEPPPGPVITTQQALAATEAVAPAIEIVDSRIRDWRIKLPDTVADNASYGGFAVGSWSRALAYEDLRTVGMVMEVDGRPYSAGVGAAALGHPAAAVAWLLTKLHGLGIATQRGDIVLSGALAAVAPVQAGSVVRLMVHRQSALTVSFE
jgi:2-keto-4-pentenoate hydratase